MARIKFGASVAGISGTIGGITYSRNGSSNYARAWARGANPRTTLQSAQRGPWSARGLEWRALSAAQRTAWDAWAALAAQEKTDPFGDPYYASGWNWFTTINTRLQRAGLSLLSDPPTAARPAAPTLSTLSADASTPFASNVTFPSGEFDPDLTAVVWATVAPSAGNAVPRLQYVQLLLDSTQPATTITFGSELVARVGELTAGQKLFLQLNAQTTEGVRSSPTTITTIVVP